ncbi:hypothetical protein GTA08_BOTSDO03215 [Botryosphaeria dothidea]|uniref:Uncharacterized protein n=1 Tax=Botryosphaeria dothidea TaxID=55169 RepID=A0A8H4N6V6_9PEZI|nr:hypothetical protein GTA08_BOTSDO03215 [Botryosphaeria dothidea]
MSASQNSATQKELKTIDQEWGDTTLKNGANMQGSTEENANVHQKWRNTSIEDGFNVQGKHSTRDIEALERVENTTDESPGNASAADAVARDIRTRAA